MYIQSTYTRKFKIQEYNIIAIAYRRYVLFFRAMYMFTLYKYLMHFFTSFSY